MLSIILLIGFIKISLHYNNPPVLAGIYTGFTTIINAFLIQDLTVVALSAAATFGLMWLFFWLLDRFEDSGLWWLFVFLFPLVVLLISGTF